MAVALDKKISVLVESLIVIIPVAEMLKVKGAVPVARGTV